MRSALLLLTLPCAAAQLEIRVVDERGAPVWARLEVHGAGGTMLRAEGSIHSSRQNQAKWNYPYLGSFVVKGECRLEVEAGRYRIVAERGTEHERVERTVEATGAGAAVRVQVKPWIRMNERGWWSGDMHVHRPLEDSEALVQAEDLNLGVVFTMWNRQNLWAGKALPSSPVKRIDASHTITVMNAEDERGGGAWMLHHLREPLGLETVVPAAQKVTESWTPAGIEFVRKARAGRGPLFPWFDSEKPIWWEAPVMMALEAPDSLGLMHNHFHQYGMMANEAWGRARDTAKFPEQAGFAEYSLQLIYRYWNLGLRIPPSAGSASGVLPNPVGYNRMYVRLGDGFDLERWYEGVRARKLFVTNGPMLFFETRVTAGRLRGTIEAVAREPIDRCEIVVNGEIVWRRAANGNRLRAEIDVDAAKHSWAAARCYLKTTQTVRMAHSAPIDLPGKWNAGGDARYFVEWIDELIARTQSFPALHDNYRKARQFYASRQ